MANFSPKDVTVAMGGTPILLQSNLSLPYNLVVVHPLVLLSVVDHYTRVAKDTNKRVVGVLLGEVYKGKVDITNSYAGNNSTQNKQK